jgi:Xaa-Pro aminopeptidase
MQTMRPVLRHGRSVWDQSELPLDEFQARAERLDALLRQKAARAAVIVGGGDQYANLAYLTNFVPGHRWATLVHCPGEEPMMLYGLGGGRDLPYVRSVCRVADVRYAPSLGEAIAGFLDDRGVRAGTVATAGLDTCWPVAIHRGAVDALRRYRLVPIDGELADLRRVKRPRELRLIRRAQRVVERARMAAVDAFTRGQSNAACAAAAERAARLAGAHDVRTLANVANAGELRPYAGADDRRHAHLVCYLAVEIAGYWADGGFTYPSRIAPAAGDLRAALGAMRQAAVPGARAADLAQAGAARSPDTAGWGFGGGIGLELAEHPRVDPASSDVLREGEVLSLRCGRAGPGCALESEMVVVSPGGGVLIGDA